MRTKCDNCENNEVKIIQCGVDEKIARCTECNSMVDYFAYDSWIETDEKEENENNE